MKAHRVFLVVILSFAGLAQGTDSKIKSWKTLVNDNGYELKYPDCWAVRPDNPDELNQPVTVAKDIAIEETKDCATPLLDPPHQNSIGFSTGWTKTPSSEEVLKEVQTLEKRSTNNILRKSWLYFKRIKVGPYEAYVDLSLRTGVGYTWIFWEMELYCPIYKVSFSGPGIRDPDKALLDKFKAGDIAMPEPEKTIFESIRCVEPKKTRSSEMGNREKIEIGTTDEIQN